MTNIPSAEQLRRAASIAEEIEKLQGELTRLLGGERAAAGQFGQREQNPAVSKREGAATVAQKDGNRRRRSMSAETRAKMVAAQRARWAKTKGERKQAADGSAQSKPKRAKPVQFIAVYPTGPSGDA